jgi:tetratricopeptide (TPR) repeat protein
MAGTKKAKKGPSKTASKTKAKPAKAAKTVKAKPPAKPAKAPPKKELPSNVPKALAEKVAKAAKHIDGKFCYGLPHYELSAKMKFSLVELGDMELFEENEVDTDENTGWIPFAHLGSEPQFLAIHTEAPYRVGMWEHENGEIYSVWASLDDFTGRVLDSKKDKTPYELLDKVMDKASKLVDDDKYAEALALLEPAVAKLPSVSSEKRDDQISRLNNMWGLALKGVKRYEEALAAFERAAKAGEDYAVLNICDVLLETMKEPKRALERALAMREGYLTPYERTWSAIYIAKASLDLGDAATAEKELRDIVDRYAVKDAKMVTSAREAIEEYVKEEGRAGKATGQAFLAWLKPKSYDDISPEDVKTNRAWWTSLDKKIAETLLEEVKIEDVDPADATDAQIAQCLDTEACDVRNDEEHPLDDITPFLRLTNAERIGFYGDPESIEPFRALPKLERLTINNVLIKEFAWPSRVQRDLWKAAEAGDQKGCEAALKAGADVNAHSTDWGKTAFHFVPFGEEHRALAMWLIEQGADPYAGNHGDGGDFQVEWWADDLKERVAAAVKKFGHSHPEESPWREFEVGRAKASATFDSPDFSIEGKGFDDGDSLVNEWPKDAKLQMQPPKKDNKIYDVMRVKYGNTVVSEKVAEVLRADPNIELLPVTLIDHAKKVVPGTWYFVNPLAKNCLIPEKCHFQWNHIDPDSASSLCAYAIDASKVEGAQMFRPTIVNSRPMIVTKELADKLAAFGACVRITTLKR